MLLKRLEIQGFKSFPDRTAFKFQQDGLTAVVGPNGCGKSNIVDAVRWALGEQSAKLLRGQMMEDVIFNGSDRRKPAGMSEVTLTFINDGTLENQWRDYSEISVSRKLFRTGESEYLINGVPCRLKDIRELIADAGGSSRGYSIVEQGRISLLVNSKPEEKRALIEEAAGVLKYRLRRLEAERKMERTRQNLLRVSDVLREVQRQLNSMKRSAARARRYRALREELSSLVLRLRYEEFISNDTLLDELEREKTGVRDELSGLESQLFKLEAKEEELRNDLVAGEGKITDGYEGVRSIEAEIAGLEADISVREESIKSLEERLERLSEDEGDLAKQTETNHNELKQLELDLAAIESEHDERVSELAVLEEQFALSEKNLVRTKEEIENTKGALFAVGTERNRLEMTIEAGNRSREILRVKREEASVRRGVLCERVKEAEQEVRKREECFARAVVDSDKAASELAGMRREIQGNRGALDLSEGRLVSFSERQAELRGLMKTLIALEEELEGLPDGARSVMLNFRETGQSGVLGIVADYMEVPQQYERAVMAVLGERLGHVVVEGPENGRCAVDYLKEKAAGRGSFIPKIPRTNGKDSLEGATGSGIIGPLSGLVDFSKELNGLGDFLLGGALLVEDLEVALNLWKRNGFAATMVTLDGDVVDSSGIISGGSQNVEETPLARKRKIRDVRHALTEVERNLEKEKEKRNDLRDLISRGESRLETLDVKNREAVRNRISSESDVALSAGELNNLRNSLEDLESEIKLADLEDADLANSVEESTVRLKELERQEEDGRCTILQLDETSKKLESEMEDQRTSLEQSRIKVSTVQLRRENSNGALEAARNRSLDSEQRRMRIDTEIEDAESLVIVHRSEIEKSRESVRSAVIDLEGKRESLIGLRKHQEEARRTSDLLGSEIRELRSALGTVREKVSGIDIRIHELRAERQYIISRVSEEHNCDVGELKAADFESEPFERDEANKRIDFLREKISKLGEVNPGAVEEFEELNERFTFLSTQKKDLEESVESLHKAIRKINRTSRERFLSTFSKVNENFSRLFPRLLNGGSAEMILLDESDPLNSGVDINVRLPGKRVKSMQLLSGGEKAMVSLTMILSMFLAKPSPVCILDEVDAPLDDENLGNFAAIVREMSQRFQFLIITHNKLTMEAVDVLYGITMREPGVSQVVSVKLKDIA